MNAVPLSASKRCPHCGQWSDHQHRPDDRCTHCHELLDPKGPQKAAEMEQAWKWEMPPVMLIDIKPTDGAVLRFFKYIIRGGQLAFASLVAFIIWVVTVLAG
ncbi:hypothetical protein F0P96_16015 [Hymenobacter busanensis]|uniref:Uncharacterized protein n=1 Tax=Hymenobacter busanensis TaxID=2607656 RepID=A0A7L4ZTM5_9BACT|nr:hypothetical protein [Hymenobacter busanensis]KAA9327487.1 hypothetical protein F0P96_16015 [Hymenobacter busanensis]QHJ06175.1 hypothetical protein GUY19_02220 [Hymenobacter busanensis]